MLVAQMLLAGAFLIFLCSLGGVPTGKCLASD